MCKEDDIRCQHIQGHTRTRRYGAHAHNMYARHKNVFSICVCEDNALSSLCTLSQSAGHRESVRELWKRRSRRCCLLLHPNPRLSTHTEEIGGVSRETRRMETKASCRPSPPHPHTLLLLSFSSLQRQTRALTYTPRLARPNPLSLFSLCVRVSRVSPSSARFTFSLSHIHEHTHIDTASLLTRVPPSVPFILVLCLVDFLVSSRLVYPVLRVFHPRRLRAFSLFVLLLFLLAFLFSNDPHTHKSTPQSFLSSEISGNPREIRGMRAQRERVYHRRKCREDAECTPLLHPLVNTQDDEGEEERERRLFAGKRVSCGTEPT